MADAPAKPRRRKTGKRKPKVSKNYACYALPGLQVDLEQEQSIEQGRAELCAAVIDSSEQLHYAGQCKGTGPAAAAHKKVRAALDLGTNIFALRKLGQHRLFMVYGCARLRRPLEYTLDASGERVRAVDTSTGKEVAAIVRHRQDRATGQATVNRYWPEYKNVVRPSGRFECTEKPTLPKPERAGVASPSDAEQAKVEEQ